MACGVETVTVIGKRSGGRSVVKGRNPRHAPLITILGGVLTMMGQHFRSEMLFYYFRPEDQVPEPPAAAHRKTHQLWVCARAAEREL
jgi:hypothetical protein